ncbi:NADPH-dependent pterin aldehyde reductase-like [Elaeis guineensis]|uniref:NADPH-dependent pterin aldehyde reductase n=1 Tax=Elaeis guineensis var. tenera TaxID=51953 RepID=A0A6I9RPV7_ELAGV|nr:NADPH-dependent pterin aldehyde reductase [Elaeis guineensis]
MTVVLKGAGAPRTVLITGVSRGLGRALALELAKRGHTIIGFARSQEKIDALLAELPSDDPAPSSSPSKHLIIQADVRSDSSIKELARLVVETRRVPDIIVNNAGTINKNNKIWDVSAEEFDMVIDTNIKGVANILRNFLPVMIEKKRGIIVNTSSGWGRSAAAEVAPYCASKWAIEGLTRSVAKELPPGVAVVALSPGVVNTEMLASCFGSSSALYQTPESWAPKAATFILNLTVEDNGASLTV